MKTKTFDIFINSQNNKKNVIFVDQLRYNAPPLFLRIGVLKNREESYFIYLKDNYFKNTSFVLEELLSIHRLSIIKKEVTFTSSKKELWITQGFVKFFLFILPTLELL